MLGIYPSDFDADVAEKLGVPVKEGIRLDDVVEGMGAARAGLEKNDVIVSMAGSSITDYPSFLSAIQHQRAGNIVEVVFYRGSEKRTVNMELSRRNIPEIPATVSDLAQAATDHYAQIEREVDQFFKDVTEAEASFKPQPDEWSVKEVLAHLILSERATQAFIVDVLAGQEKWSDEYSDNIQPPISALTAVHPTLPGMLDELKRCYAESIALYTNISADFPEKRRGSYWRIAYYLLDGTVHEHFHFDQMKAAIEAAQKA